MAIDVKEVRASREGDDQSTELLYECLGTADETEAEVAVLAVAPAAYRGLSRGRIRRRPIFVDVASPARSRWEISVPYAAVQWERPETGDSVFSFETGGKTQHITQSLATVASYAPPGMTARNYQRAIGVSGTGEDATVEGTDIVVPTMDFNELFYLPAAYVTPAYRKGLFWTTGKVNQAAFRTFDAGEVIFLGASGSRRGRESTDDWEVTFKFSASPNVTDEVIGEMTGIRKRGWEHLWVQYEKGEVEFVTELIPRPVAVYVEQVYKYGDFRLLGIGS
jgi:hypothetical protein